MTLRIFSVAGEALNFGARRMETIMRVAWLPVLLLLILNMATVFAYLSAILGRPITFADAGSFAVAEQALGQLLAKGLAEKPQMLVAITGMSLFFQIILVSSFMAPLIRYAGLGERPGRGVVRLPFGADQLRFILSGIFSFFIITILVLAPMAAATYYIIQYLAEALSQTLASFPDPNSLHTIELTTVQKSLIAKGTTWLYDFGIPLGVVAPFLMLIWLVLFLHFHPRNRSVHAGPPNSSIRLLLTGVVVALVTGGLYLGLAGLAKESPASGEGAPFALFAVFAILIGYLSIRLFPYAGVVVCRKSMVPAGTLKVTRGWNLIRLAVTLGIVWLFLVAVQYVFNTYVTGWIISAIGMLYSAVSTYTRLVNSGVTGEWVLPLFVWIWAMTKILINIFLMFFSYGTISGLYGRLYRESERVEIAGEEPQAAKRGSEVWRKS